VFTPVPVPAPAPWRPTDPDFPNALRPISQSPKILYTIGSRATLEAPCVAVVGTRRPTPYGERVTHQIATALAHAGACIISGMAYGIDAIAHRAALAANGRTAAILGTGIDAIYPQAHRSLYNQIAATGLLVSEYKPGTKAFRGSFPRRNRIIAGLSAVTIVVEAGPKSGALITAKHALDADRVVAAVPGPIESSNSHGPNHLIRDGAHVIATVDDALMLLGLSSPAIASPALAGDQAAVWDVLSTPGLTTDDVIQQTGLPTPRCLAAITHLELQGLVTCLSTGEIRRL
jgi:DNA processing protein